MEKNDHMPYKIRRITEENGNVRTFEFEGSAVDMIKPGNYVAVWIPCVSENPFSVAGKNPMKIMVKKVGNKNSFTSHMFRKNEGDKIFIRGPYGNSFLDFHMEGKPSYVIAGGIGIAPLCHLLNELDKENTDIWMGFKSRTELILPPEISAFNHIITTDDGTYGDKGFVTDLFERREIKNNSQFYICGPERMMKIAAEKAMKHTDPENIIFAVERYMKCIGQGSCGHCEIKGKDMTYSACTDGPVFTYKQLMDGDFGKYAKGRSGKKIVI